MTDLIIPLGTGSRFRNDELRIFLRSLEKNGRGIRRVIAVAAEPPEWLRNVVLLKLDDPLPNNKDGNIIRKILFALKTVGDVPPDFVWSADDCALLRPFDLASVPPVFNARRKEAFAPDGSKWCRRVRRTFDFLESRGVHLDHNFESHTPQRFPSAALLEAMRGIDYESKIGYAVNTLFFGLLGVTGGSDQRLFKETCERDSGWRFDKTMIGYNDAAFSHGLREELFRRFPDKSKFERR